MESLTADEVRARLLTRERHVFRSKRIVGRLDLSFITIPVPIEFVGCEFDGLIDLTGADCLKLDFAESKLHRGLTAEFARIRGPVFLNRGVVSTGQVRFTQATIDGDVDLSRATVTMGSSSKPSISLRGAKVLGSVLMHTLRTNAEVRLQHARIGGLLGMAGARLEVGNGIALNLNGAEVVGNIYLDGGFVATGEVGAAGLRLAGALDCQEAVVTNAGGFALRMERARFDTDVRLQGLQATGEVGFNGSTIGGDVWLTGASIDNGDGIAFGARSTQIRGSLHLDATTDGRPFRAVGMTGLVGLQIDGLVALSGSQFACSGAYPAVTLSGSRIGGDLWAAGCQIDGVLKFARSRIGGRVHLRRVHITGNGVVAVNAEHAQVDGGIYLTNSTIANGEFDLTGARTTTLVDDLDSWPEQVELDDFVYQNMPGLATRRPHDRQDRIAWLGRQQRMNASSYAHFASVLRDHGRRGSADRVMVALHRREIAAKEQRWRRAMGWLDEKLLGFGYQPWRMVIAIAGLVALVAIAVALPGARAVMLATDSRGDVHFAGEGCAAGLVRCYNPTLFALDTVIPLLDLGHRSTWRPTRGGDFGGVFEWGLAVAGIIGWAASTIFVLSFARFHRSE